MNAEDEAIADVLWDRWDCNVGQSDTYNGLFVEAGKWNRDVAELVVGLSDVREIELFFDSELNSAELELSALSDLRAFTGGDVSHGTSFSFADGWQGLRRLGLAIAEDGSTVAVDIERFVGCLELTQVRLYGVENASGTFKFCGSRELLEKLECRRIAIDDTLVELARCRVLRELDLANCQFNGSGEAFSFMETSSVSDVDLSATGISDVHLESVSRCAGLSTLHLRDTAVSGDGLQLLTQASRLAWLSLDVEALTESGINALRRCSNLRELWVWGDSIEEERKQRLLSVLPNCEVTFWM